VLEAMKAHAGVVKVQWASCWTLFCLCVHNEEMQTDVAAHGAVRAVLKAMEQHQANAGVQEAGSWVLKELAGCTAKSSDTATFSASIQAVLKVLDKFPTAKAVQTAAKGALRQLAIHDNNGWVRRICVGRSGRLGRSTTMHALATINECE